MYGPRGGVAGGRFLSILPASMLTFANHKPAAKDLPLESATAAGPSESFR